MVRSVGHSFVSLTEFFFCLITLKEPLVTEEEEEVAKWQEGKEEEVAKWQEEEPYALVTEEEEEVAKCQEVRIVAIIDEHKETIGNVDGMRSTDDIIIMKYIII